MRVAVTGATGNVGTAVVRALDADPAIDEIVGFARRPPQDAGMPVRWEAGDVRDPAALDRAFAGADAVIHLAWAIQPARDRTETRTINVDGSRETFAAAGRAGVTTLIHASSVGAYSPHESDDPVGEDFATDGIASSFYSVDKADAERELDAFEQTAAAVRVVRLRPGLIFQRSAATEIRRLFAGPLLPGVLLAPGRLPLLPRIPGVRFQGVHTDDIADAYRRALVTDSARGAFNVAAGDVLDLTTVAELLKTRTVPLPYGIARAAAGLAYQARLSPTEAGWLDLGSRAPLLRTDRARTVLGWTPTRSGREALAELLDGMRHGDDAPTPALSQAAGGPFRIREFLTGLGARR